MLRDLWRRLLVQAVLTGAYVALLRQPQVMSHRAKESIVTFIWMYATMTMTLGDWRYAKVLVAVMQIWIFGWLFFLALGFWPLAGHAWSQIPSFVDYLFVALAGIGLVDSILAFYTAWIGTKGHASQ